MNIKYPEIKKSIDSLKVCPSDFNIGDKFVVIHCDADNYYSEHGDTHITVGSIIPVAYKTTDYFGKDVLGFDGISFSWGKAEFATPLDSSYFTLVPAYHFTEESIFLFALTKDLNKLVLA